MGIDIVPWSIGMAMPAAPGLCACADADSIFEVAFVDAGFSLAADFLVVFSAVFFIGAFFAGIGIFMRGMFIDCADAGAITVANASALAAAKRATFTIDLQWEAPP